MRYYITDDGINKVKAYNKLVADLADIIPDTSDVNKINKILDFAGIPAKDLDDIAGQLGRAELFNPYQLGMIPAEHLDREFTSEEVLSFIDKETIDRLVEHDLIEEVEEDPDDDYDFLTILKANMVDGKSLIHAIVEITEGMAKHEIDQSIADVMESDVKFLSGFDKLFIVKLIDSWDIEKFKQYAQIEEKLISKQ